MFPAGSADGVDAAPPGLDVARAEKCPRNQGIVWIGFVLLHQLLYRPAFRQAAVIIETDTLASYRLNQNLSDTRDWRSIYGREAGEVKRRSGQISKASSLNEICDAARLHESELNRIRNATAPKRNTFSNANRTPDPDIAERLYWETFKHLQTICPGFTQCGKHSGFIFRVKRNIFAIDSTTLKLSLDCIDWARHRRKKAAAKTHMRLNIGTMLPAFAVVEDAAHHDSKRADVLCEGLKDGDVLLVDRPYVDMGFLHGLSGSGVFFVLRDKEMTFITNNFA